MRLVGASNGSCRPSRRRRPASSRAWSAAGSGCPSRPRWASRDASAGPPRRLEQEGACEHRLAAEAMLRHQRVGRIASDRLRPADGTIGIAAWVRSARPSSGAGKGISGQRHRTAHARRLPVPIEAAALEPAAISGDRRASLTLCKGTSVAPPTRPRCVPEDGAMAHRLAPNLQRAHDGGKVAAAPSPVSQAASRRACSTRRSAVAAAAARSRQSVVRRFSRKASAPRPRGGRWQPPEHRAGAAQAPAARPRHKLALRRTVSARSRLVSLSACRLGASASWRLQHHRSSAAMPAAGSRWPMFDFTEPTAMLCGATPLRRGRAGDLDGSPRRAGAVRLDVEMLRAATLRARAAATSCPGDRVGHRVAVVRPPWLTELERMTAWIDRRRPARGRGFQQHRADAFARYVTVAARAEAAAAPSLEGKPDLLGSVLPGWTVD